MIVSDYGGCGVEMSGLFISGAVDDVIITSSLFMRLLLSVFYPLCTSMCQHLSYYHYTRELYV